MIKLISCKLTYCHVCGRPTYCGEFELSGWRHVFCICPSCLQRFISEIERLAFKELTDKD